MLFHEKFKRTVSKYSSKIAVVWNEQAITYKELDEKSTWLAETIAGQGIGKEQIVAIDLGRNIDAVAAMVAVLKAGCAFVFTDAKLPPERKNYILNDCNCQLIINNEYINNLDHMLRKQPAACSPEDLAVVIYTSGSTGKPKGVMIEQQNIAALIDSYSDMDIREDDVFGVFPNFSFIAAMNDIFTPLSIGATIDIVPEDIRKHITLMSQYYLEHKITVTYLPPHMVLKYLKCDRENATLRLLLVGGEAAHNLGKRRYDIRNVYAATELCQNVSNHLITEATADCPIGKIKKNLKYYILDEDNQEVRPGEIGELCISGQQISRGYLNLPELTAKQFISNPFTQEPTYEVLFKTRDLVRELPDQTLCFVGRKDYMLKIRGYRVEPKEVEGAMLRFPGIDEAVVTAYKVEGRSDTLCGYYTANKEINEDELREFLRNIVPSYMVPAKMIKMDSFPHNHNDKIDRGQLPPPGE
ncbi:MAG: amino acid adenylation domain-containing protein [Lachnospiraceae bacterium]